MSAKHHQTGADSCACGNLWPCNLRRAPIAAPTAGARRGISQILALAYADVECAFPGDFSAKELADLEAAFAYLSPLAGVRHRSIT